MAKGRHEVPERAVSSVAASNAKGALSEFTVIMPPGQTRLLKRQGSPEHSAGEQDCTSHPPKSVAVHHTHRPGAIPAALRARPQVCSGGSQRTCARPGLRSLPRMATSWRTPKYLPLPHPTSAMSAPGGSPCRNCRTLHPQLEL